MSRYIRDARSGRVCRYSELGGSYYAEDPGAPVGRDALVSQLQELDINVGQGCPLSDSALDEILTEARRLAQEEGVAPEAAQPMSERRGGRRSSGTHFAEVAQAEREAKAYAERRNKERRRHEERQRS